MKKENKKRLLTVLFFVGIAVLLYLYWRGQQDTSFEYRLERVSTNEPATFNDNELLIDFKDDVDQELIKNLSKKYKIKLRFNSIFSKARKLYRAKVEESRLAKLLASIKKEDGIEFVEADMLYGLPKNEESYVVKKHNDVLVEGFPNDPKYQYQWHFEQIKMKKAWKLNQGEGVIVAVIDTGVAYTDYKKGKKEFKAVPDLAQTEMVEGYDFVNNRKLALDDHGHGTHVAGTIAQSTHNKEGVAGIAFKAKIMPLKVLSARGFGNVADIAEAVRFAANKGAKIINMSLGGPKPSKVLADAVTYAHKKGVFIVCAAGNDGKNKVGYPAAYPGAFAVAATQFDRTTTFYSNYGKHIAIAAPGGNTRVDQNKDGMPDGVLQNTIQIGNPAKNDYLLFMGTSMASPHVAGVAALVASAGVTQPDAIAKVLTETAVHPQKKKWDERYGAGIVDAEAALVKVKAKWGAEQFGVSLVFAFMLLGFMRTKGIVIQPTISMGAGLLFGSAGLFFLPLLGIHLPSTIGSILTQGLPSWDMAVFGESAHGNPLFFSALIPIACVGLLYQFNRIHRFILGLVIGIAAHLFFFAAFRAVDIQFIPNIFDSIYLIINAVTALFFAGFFALKS